MAIIIYAVLYIGITLGLYSLFPKAGRQSWEALIPGYNFFIWLKVIKKPWWWLILLVFPGPNIIMFMIMSVNLGTVFGKRSPQDVALNAFLPFVMLPLLGFKEEPKYVGPIDRIKYPKGSVLEWRDAILFAVVAASIIRTYTFEAFTIPTSSMEKDMLIGDYLFVSKLSYGPKVPQTPLSFPFAHHSLPLTNNTIPSYLEWIHFDYNRLPGFGGVERNDVMVFNYPAGDTVDVIVQSNNGFQQMVRDGAIQLMSSDFRSKQPLKDHKEYLVQSRSLLLKSREFTIRPVDKREHFIKRCVGIPGDRIEIENGTLYVNGEQAEAPEDMQFNYLVQLKKPFEGGEAAMMKLKEEYGVNFQDVHLVGRSRLVLLLPLTKEAFERISDDPMVDRTQKFTHHKNKMSGFTKRTITTQFDTNYVKKLEAIGNYNPDLNIFPNDPNYHWTEDNFGPLTIPKKGETVELTAANLPLYHRIISVYEGNDLAIKDGIILINGSEATSYTFQMDYYWLMGDNRHNSADSRFWGFVPEDHVVGKASMVWMSLDPELGWTDGKIRWSRFFSFVD